ncbi:MAG: glucans biosynthesis protein [Candidatus Hydrogenedentes bacterium ADurb.Bin179]|nr:MAG: glucans biosynthesis protein [Candidatus Hydrogenedentes bacterium ADurb.Bin179]
MAALNRRYDIDWLRILVVASLVPFHTARIFDIWEPNYVKNADLSNVLSYFLAFLAVWNMPLLFLLAGAASGYALEFRSSGAYLKERFRRLCIPLVFGVLVIVPPQAYIARFQQPGYAESYGRFLLDYFRVRGDLTGYTGQFTPAHLWFILYLLVFSAVALPLFLYLRRDRRVIGWLARECGRPGSLLLLAVPVGIAGALPDIGGKNPFYYFMLFLYGYILAADNRFQEAINQYKGRALILGAITMTVTLTLWALRVRFPAYSPGDVLFYLMRTFNMWFWVVALLGYARKHLNGANRFYRYANEASYPFYILHQTVIWVIGYFVVTWSANLWIKFFVIALGSFVVTGMVYDLGVRRNNLPRFLFGMKGRVAVSGPKGA